MSDESHLSHINLVFRELCHGHGDIKGSLFLFFFQEFAGLGGDVRFLKHNLEYQHSVELLQDVVSLFFNFVLTCFSIKVSFCTFPRCPSLKFTTQKFFV